MGNPTTSSASANGGKLALRAVTAGTGNTPDGGLGTTIPAGGWSEVFAFGMDLNFNLLFIFAASATGSVLVEEVIDANASVTGETWDTVIVSSERISRWTAGEALQGFGRVKNNTNQNMTAYVSGRIPS